MARTNRQRTGGLHYLGRGMTNRQDQSKDIEVVMPTKTHTRKNRAARNLQAVPESIAPSTTGHTEAEDKLWQALRANPNSTSIDLASAARIGKSTAGKILAKWANEGSVTRTPGIPESGRRAADLWAIANDHTSEARSEPTDAEATRTPETTTAEADPTNGESTDTTTADAEAATDTTEPTLVDPPRDDTTGQRGPNATPATDNSTRETTPRLAPGALRGMVEDYLRDRLGEQFSPNAIGRALNRSSGAVNNALEKLVAEGTAVKTQEAPKRFALAPAEQEAATQSTC